MLLTLTDHEPFDPVLARARRRAFHLETRDTYATDAEDASLAAFLADETTDPGGPWFDGWAALTRATVARGVAVQRARIVTEPHTAYTRYLLALARHNVGAGGEDIRYLPRDVAHRTDSASEDFWLFDDTAVAFSVFDTSGVYRGCALTEEPAIVAHAVTIRDRVWRAAIPYADYLAR